MVFGYSVLYFLLCLLVYNRDACDSEEFADRKEIIVFLCVVSIVVMFMAFLLEILAIRGKVDSCLQKTSSPEALHLNKALGTLKNLARMKSHEGSDSDGTTDNTTSSDENRAVKKRHKHARRRDYQSYTMPASKPRHHHHHRPHSNYPSESNSTSNNALNMETDEALTSV